MASNFANGTVVSISSAFGDSMAISAITNASSAVATVASTVLMDDIVLLSSDWSGINQRAARVSAFATNAATLENIDTSDTTVYPAGEGTGSLVAVKTWVQINQITEVSKSGGDANFEQWQFLEDRTGMQRQRPTYRSAKSIDLTMHFDPKLDWYSTLLSANAAGDLRILRVVSPQGDVALYPGYVSFDGDPTIAINTNETVVLSFALAAPYTFYSAS
jgi:hypothetical protein|nr:MAG TPA: tail tube protein [Caudoviricetes sp.]